MHFFSPTLPKCLPLYKPVRQVMILLLLYLHPFGYLTVHHHLVQHLECRLLFRLRAVLRQAFMVLLLEAFNVLAVFGSWRLFRSRVLHVVGLDKLKTNTLALVRMSSFSVQTRSLMAITGFLFPVCERQ